MPRSHRFVSLPVLLSIAIVFYFLAPNAAGAQLVPGLPLPLSTPNPASLVRQVGAYSIAPIMLDGVALFHVAAPTTPAPDQIPVSCGRAMSRACSVRSRH